VTQLRGPGPPVGDKHHTELHLHVFALACQRAGCRRYPGTAAGAYGFVLNEGLGAALLDTACSRRPTDANASRRRRLATTIASASRTARLNCLVAGSSARPSGTSAATYAAPRQDGAAARMWDDAGNSLVGWSASWERPTTSAQIGG